MKLTPALISNLVKTQIPDIKDLDVSNKQISHIEDISACVSLRKLNLSNNDIKSPDALSGIQYLDELTLLNLSGNRLESCEGVQKLSGLFGRQKEPSEHTDRRIRLPSLLTKPYFTPLFNESVLNMSHNEVNRISIHVTQLKALKALILNHNKIKTVENIGNLLDLNTLVLSHNKIDTLPTLPTLINLTKLSVAHNNLRLIPDLSFNTALKEARLNDNKILTIPDTVRACNALEILDLGNNLLREWSDIAPLGSLIHLLNLNLKGNPICQKPDYKEKQNLYLHNIALQILQLIPSLRVLDGVRFDPKFLERRQKQQAFSKVKQEKQQMLAKKKEIKKRKREEVGNDGSGDDMEVDEEGAGKKRKELAVENGRKDTARVKTKKREKRGAMERESESNTRGKVPGKETKKVGLKGRGPLAPHLLQAQQYDRDSDGDAEMEEASVKEKISHLKTARVAVTEPKESISSKKQSTSTPGVSKSGKKNKQSKAETDTATPKKKPTSTHADSFFEDVQKPSNPTTTTTIQPQTPSPPDPAPSAQALLRSGVVAVIDHTKKASAKGSKAGTRPMRAQIDITAVLETEARKRTLLGDGDPEDGGTGLGVDQWD
ncbi:hypothetical protein BC937DRAFT_93703 [Endogone sp. FLAS-F59071]|nr:hypothetical protein BC937DRAFT_93703 [Endogone sp. FLAS-F59071]|eukprot:RUS14510.1 hypothetical protein BC937DRAFT_93703 [Endogone sp. FLAS-F59071]